MSSVLLFDFGRVLVDFDFRHAFSRWADATGLSTLAIEKAFVQDAMYCAHERGELSWGEYAQHLRSILNLDLSDFALIEGWNAIFLNPVPGVSSTVDALSSRFRLFVLSNTNQTHYEYWSRQYASVLKPFDSLLCSHALGARKPEPEIYLRALSNIGVDANEVLFFDDIPTNVAGAQAVGMQGVLFTSVIDIHAALKLV